MESNSAASLKTANTLLTLQFISDFGDQITAALLAICILDITTSTAEVGFIYFTSTLGYVIFTLFGGMVGDRFCRRKVLVASDAARAIVVLLMIAALYGKSLTLIYLTSFLLSALGAFHRPIKLSVSTENVPTNFLGRYNSWSEMSLQISTSLGPMIAGFFAAKALTGIGFAVDALSFLICAGCFFWLLRCNDNPPVAEKGVGELLIGLKLIVAHPEAMRYVLYSTLQMIGYSAFNATFLVLAQRDFGWTKNQYSLHLSIISIGALIGATLGGTRLVETIKPKTKLIACSVIPGAALLMTVCLKSFPLSSILFSICSGIACVTLSVTRTQIQIVAKELFAEHLSSIIAARSVVIKAAALVGTCVCVGISGVLSLQTTLIIFTAPIAASFLVLFLRRKEVFAQTI